jgi:hypothetical protein
VTYNEEAITTVRRIFLTRSEGKMYFGNECIDGKIILKWTLLYDNVN